MEVYRYETRISKKGVIKLPINQQLKDRDVEIIILPRKDIRSKKKSSLDFIKKWAGFLSNVNIEDTKYQYLNEKYK
jgi:hypothetical protein